MPSTAEVVSVESHRPARTKPKRSGVVRQCFDETEIKGRLVDRRHPRHLPRYANVGVREYFAEELKYVWRKAKWIWHSNDL